MINGIEFVKQDDHCLLQQPWGYVDIYTEPEGGGPRTSLWHVRRGYYTDMQRFIPGPGGPGTTVVAFVISGMGYAIVPPEGFEPKRDGSHTLIPLVIGPQMLMRVDPQTWFRLHAAGDADLVLFVTEYNWQGTRMETMEVPNALFGPAKQETLRGQ